MRLEKKRNYGKAKRKGLAGLEGLARRAAIVTPVPPVMPVPPVKEGLDPRFHQRVELRLQLTPLRGIGEDLGGDALALRWVGDQFMNDVVGVDRLDAKFVQITSEKRFPAGNAAGKGNLHDKGKPKFGS